MRILIAEDEAHNRDALMERLSRMGHEPVAAGDGQEALELCRSREFDLVLSDVRMPRLDGIGFLDAFRRACQGSRTAPPFVFMTAYGRLDEAVRAMRMGAMNFLVKPVTKKDLARVLDEAMRAREHAVAAGHAPVNHVSRAFGEALAVVEKAAPTQASVLFVGESGTGKEVLARRLHELSGRRSGPFVAFHPGATPEPLFESTLFGHEKGAFTGAETASLGLIRAASFGTFFLDELATMPLSVQAKLLRVLQDKKVTPVGATRAVECSTRWVAATNRELEPLVEQGLFREDLLYRLRVVVIRIPPLRDRPDDIPGLTDCFLVELAAREGKPALSVPPDTRELLRNHSWPGNVRELRNVVEQAVVLSDGDELAPRLLPPHIRDATRAREIRVAVGSSLQSAQDRLIRETLVSCQGDKVRAAELLGVNPRTIYRWLDKN